MLAGLLFAIRDTDDRPDQLTATLPFGGVTLIEHQARQLIAAGATQIVVVAARLTPELMGALNRVGRRGVAVDPVRNAAEAAQKLHPLARILTMADGLMTTGAIVSAMAGETGDTLLVTTGGSALPGFERVGGGMAWAGIAALDARRITELAALPRDYDPQSTLVRVAEAAGAGHVVLPDAALREGHGIDHATRGVDVRGRQIVAAAVSASRNGFSRFVIAPIARLAVPALVARSVSGLVVGGGALAAGLIGLELLVLGWLRTGLAFAMLGTLAFAVASLLAGMRDEAGVTRATRLATGILPAAAALLTGRMIDAATGNGGALVAAVMLVLLGGVAMRAVARPRSWWGTPPAYLLILLIAALPGWSLAGIVIAAVYAAVTLVAAVETLRQP